MRNFLKVLLLSIITIEITGCAALVAPNYSPNYEAIEQLKKVKADHLSVGSVKPTDPNAKVNKISLRASSLTTANGSFSKYLESALISDLTELAFYDASAATRIDVEILKNDIDISGFSVGTGVLEAKLKVTRSGSLVLDKTYIANTKFDSSFVGAVAIPKGQAEYPNLVREFLTKVYTDSEFIQAIQK